MAGLTYFLLAVVVAVSEGLYIFSFFISIYVTGNYSQEVFFYYTYHYVCKYLV